MTEENNAGSPNVEEGVIVDLDAPEDVASTNTEGGTQAESPTVVVAESNTQINAQVNTPAKEEDDSIEEGDLSPEELQRLKDKTRKRIQTLARKAKDVPVLTEKLADYERQIRERDEKLQELQTVNVNVQEQNVTAQKAAAQAVLEGAKQSWLKAEDVGNREGMLEANEKMVEAKARLLAIAQYEARMAAAKAAAPVTKEKTEATTEVAKPQIDPQAMARDKARAEKWVKENPWIDRNSGSYDPAMAIVLREVHDTLIKAEGFNPLSDDPDVGREAYWAELDNRMRQYFPHKFKVAGGKPDATGKTPVAGVPRTPVVKNKNEVHLTPGEVERAKRLGVSLKDYAREKLKIQQERGER